jgi:hypothetical protein
MRFCRTGQRWRCVINGNQLLIKPMPTSGPRTWRQLRLAAAWSVAHGFITYAWFAFPPVICRG